MGVGLVAVVVCLWVGAFGRGRLYNGSLYIHCVEFGVSGVGFCLIRLRDVGEEGCGVGVVRFMSSMRWDLRVVTLWAVVWRVIVGLRRVVFVPLISCMICVILWSSSPVRVYRR